MSVRLISLALSLTLTAAVWLTPSRAHATPEQRLIEARDAFQAGDFDKAIPLLSYLLYPDVRLARKPLVIEARILLGVAYFEIGNKDEARREFEDALLMDDKVELDELLFSAQAIAFFAGVEADFREQRARDAQALALARDRERLRKALENIVVIERRPYFINFVPFGAGQFQNGHNIKGLLFFAAEAGICGASVTLWSIQVGKYGFNGTVPSADVNSVRTMQQWQVAAGATCLVLMGAGIVDALINYKSETRLPADESLLPDDFQKRPPGDKRSSLVSMPRVGLTGSLLGGFPATGVAMSWEF